MWLHTSSTRAAAMSSLRYAAVGHTMGKANITIITLVGEFQLTNDDEHADVQMQDMYTSCSCGGATEAGHQTGIVRLRVVIIMCC